MNVDDVAKTMCLLIDKHVFDGDFRPMVPYPVNAT